MTRFLVNVCDHVDCQKAATRRVVVVALPAPTTGPLFVSEGVPDPMPSAVVDACDEHAADLDLDAAAGRAGWTYSSAEPPAEIPAGLGRQWSLIQGGRGRGPQ